MGFWKLLGRVCWGFCGKCLEVLGFWWKMSVNVGVLVGNVCKYWGFGGKCFPKDLNALVVMADECGVDMKTLKAAWETNLKVRK